MIALNIMFLISLVLKEIKIKQIFFVKQYSLMIFKLESIQFNAKLT